MRSIAKKTLIKNVTFIFLFVAILIIVMLAGCALKKDSDSNTPTTNKYTITWKNYDGTVLEVDGNVESGAMPSYDGVTPTKEGNDQYTYIFNGWSPTVKSVTGNQTYIAQFSEVKKSYTITWDIDGTKTTETYLYGEVPTYKGVPAKEENAEFSYTFTDWTPKITAVTGDKTYKALFSEVKKNYTITWDIEGVKTTEIYAYGEIPTYKGTPIKEGDSIYTYTFTGWTPMITAVTGDKTYIAQFTSTANKYTIMWANYDGSILKIDENLEYGVLPIYDGEIPTKEGNAQFTYTFTGWSPEVTEVTENQIYIAQFSENKKSYTITWNIDGEKTTETYAYGERPMFKGTPTKEGNDEFAYIFTGWTPEITIVTEDKTYIAQFKENPKIYVITWDIEGIKTTEIYAYGEIPWYKGTPAKEGNAEFTYTFIGWTPVITAVTGNQTYIAQFSENKNNYTITWDIDGVKTTETYAYGEFPTFKGTPTKEGDAEFTYTFIDWTPEITAVTGDATYTAQFSQAINSYTITWDIDGEKMTESYLYGETPTYKNGTPTKERTAEFTYTFTGWSPKITTVTGDKTYTAKFSAIRNSYTITWVVEGEETTETYEYGEKPTYKNGKPVKEENDEFSYEFITWTPEITTVTGDQTYTAKFFPERKTYTIIWLNYNEGLLKMDKDVAYGVMPTYDGETPTREGNDQYTYTFIGWTPEITIVTGNQTYVAQFREDIKNYTITWDIEGAQTMETYPYGEIPEYKNGIPTKVGNAEFSYPFIGWTPEIKAVTGDATYTAQFVETKNSYTITWDVDGEITTENYLYGEVPSYSGTPVKEATAEYSYTFTSWTPEITMVTGNETYTAIFEPTPIKYSIGYNLDGGTNAPNNPTNYDCTKEIVLDYPTKTGYTFLGWTYEDQIEPNKDLAIPAGKTGDIEFTANWMANTYQITLDANGGEVSATTFSVKYDGDYSLPTPTRKGYTFNGWYDGATRYGSGKWKTASNVTLTAKWTLSIYPIYYILDGGTNSTRNPSSYTVNSEFTLEKPIKDGYTFLGWTYNGTVDPVEKVVISAGTTGSIEFIAHWRENQHYEIIYENTYGWIMPSETIYSAPLGKILDLSSLIPTAPQNYTFLGWTRTLNGTDYVTKITVGTNNVFYLKYATTDFTVSSSLLKSYSLNNVDGIIDDNDNDYIDIRLPGGLASYRGAKVVTATLTCNIGVKTATQYSITDAYTYAYGGLSKSSQNTPVRNQIGRVQNRNSTTWTEGTFTMTYTLTLSETDTSFRVWMGYLFTTDGNKVTTNRYFKANFVSLTYRIRTEKSKTYVITFNPNGGTLQGKNSIQYSTGEIINHYAFPYATLSGQVFCGWTKTKNGTDFVNDINATGLSNYGYTLYASWVPEKLLSGTLQEERLAYESQNTGEEYETYNPISRQWSLDTHANSQDKVKLRNLLESLGSYYNVSYQSSITSPFHTSSSTAQGIFILHLNYYFNTRFVINGKIFAETYVDSTGKMTGGTLVPKDYLSTNCSTENHEKLVKSYLCVGKSSPVYVISSGRLTSAILLSIDIQRQYKHSSGSSYAVKYCAHCEGGNYHFWSAISYEIKITSVRRT